MNKYLTAGLDEMDIELLQTPIRTLLSQGTQEKPDYSFFHKAVRAKDTLGEFFSKQRAASSTGLWRWDEITQSIYNVKEREATQKVNG